MAKFTWGDTVRIAQQAPATARPGETAEVVGISEEHLHYTVEFEDGSDAEVLEDHLICSGRPANQSGLSKRL